MKQAKCVVGMFLGLTLACGGHAIPAAHREAASTQAAAIIQASNAQAATAKGLGDIGQSLSGTLTSATPGTSFALDLTGLPPPTTTQGTALSLRRPQSRYVAAPGTTGCVQPDPGAAGQARFISAGGGGCNATDHVQVDYLNGDEVNYTFTDTGFTMWVTKGPWLGTRISFTFLGTDSQVKVTFVGTLKYSGSGGNIDTDFNSLLDLGTGSTDTRIQLSGLTTDHIARHQVNSDFTLDLQSTGGGNSGSAVSTWDGTATIGQLLPNSEIATDPATEVKWVGLSIRYDFNSSPNSFSQQQSASGRVLFGGTEVGHLGVDHDGVIQVYWTDGKVTPFDVSVLFATF